jgi:WD repeat and SOF domain-containing protein 1
MLCFAMQYVRAVTAVKLDRMFSKPFVAAMGGHMDAVTCSAVSSKSLVGFVSGAADGEVRVWDLTTNRGLWSVAAHRGQVRGVCVSADGLTFLSCGDDSAVKQWPLVAAPDVDGDDGVVEPVSLWMSKSALRHVV